MVNINTIKAEMARKHLTQKQLANLLKISTSAMSMKMNSRLDFTIKELIAMSHEFQLTVNDLLE